MDEGKVKTTEPVINGASPVESTELVDLDGKANKIGEDGESDEEGHVDLKTFDSILCYIGQFDEIALPLNKEKLDYDKCKRYVLPKVADINSTISLDEYQNLLADEYRKRYDANYTSGRMSLWETTDCGNSWSWDRSTYETSVVMDWNLVCENTIFRAGLRSAFYIGKGLGSVVFGIMSDKIGRKPTLMAACLLMTIAGTVEGLVPEYYSFNVFRVLIGMADAGAFIVAFVLAVEFVGPMYRYFAGVMTNMFYCIGYISVALIAFALRQWRHLEFAISVPWIVFISYWWILSESPRWLLAKGRLKEADEAIRRASRVNKKPLPSYYSVNKIEITQAGADRQKRANILDLVRTGPRMRARILITAWQWVVTSGVYYGLSLNTSDMEAGNDYVNFALSGLVEIPATLVALATTKYLGRKWSQIGALLVGAISCGFVSLFIGFKGTDLIYPNVVDILIVTFSTIGKFCLTIAYSVIYLWTGEMFPTGVRNAAVGTGSLAARIGGISAPFLLELNSTWKPLPLLIFAVISLTGSLLAFFLPETNDRQLPETLEDGENFGLKSSRIERQRSSKGKIMKKDTENEDEN